MELDILLLIENVSKKHQKKCFRFFLVCLYKDFKIDGITLQVTSYYFKLREVYQLRVIIIEVQKLSPISQVFFHFYVKITSCSDFFTKFPKGKLVKWSRRSYPTIPSVRGTHKSQERHGFVYFAPTDFHRHSSQWYFNWKQL